ncbi:hypothetical protein MKW92_037758 [Papaver armeniacum]|nr:hypothetical protein MKW92_037758 [Papaver armeniacum]
MISEEEIIRRQNLAWKGRRAYLKREYIENIEVRKYLKNNPFKKTSFISDIKSLKEDDSIYVFCFSYAKVQSPTYQSFLRSLTDDNVSKVYLRGFNSSLSRAVGSTPETELRPGLHKVGIVLNSTDGLGVLLTNKTEEEILSKFREYEEFDYANPGNTPMKTLVFDKDQILPLPTASAACARRLFPILQDLEMPVELVDNGRRIKWSIMSLYQSATGLLPQDKLNIIIFADLRVAYPEMGEGELCAYFLKRGVAR